ncbi:MAG: alpha-hydroxy-acid oxidizing protein [Acidimicrobiia bacterium]|nr:alpha-hydroxy-acid oxidizing protein [Acidimicrobiia bacterium]
MDDSSPNRQPWPLNLTDLEEAAGSVLSQMVFDYYRGGALDEITLRRNRAAWEEISLRYRVLCDVSTRRLDIDLLGSHVTSPVLFAPTAFHRLAHPDGELATARAARALGTVMVLSTLSTVPMEEVCAEHDLVWFQLYVYKDRGLTRDLVARAEAAGAKAIVLTVDAQMWGRRERDVRNRFHLPDGIQAVNALPGGFGEMPERAAESGLAAYVAALFDLTLSWRDLESLRSQTSLPIVLKGIVHPDDARLAVDSGIDAVVVSNHGGRQLDTAPATAAALPAVVAAVDGRIPVLVDGGIRRGTDVIKAIAMGASAVLIGRPVLWGLAVGGDRGIEQAVGGILGELDEAMALCGVTSPGDITSDLLG